MIIISWCILALGQLLFLVVQFVIRPAYTYMARKTKHYKYNIYIFSSTICTEYFYMARKFEQYK